MDKKYIKADQKIYHSKEYPSYLLLPVINLSDFMRKKEGSDKAVDNLEKYTGKYQLRPGFIITITREGKKLISQATGESPKELTHESGSRFIVSDINAPLTFKTNDKNEVTHFVTVLRGQKFHAVNLAFLKPAPQIKREPFEVNTEILKTYEGEYQLKTNIKFTVTADDKSLYAQSTGQPKFEIFPESETKFFYEVVDAQIDFKKKFIRRCFISFTLSEWDDYAG